MADTKKQSYRRSSSTTYRWKPGSLAAGASPHDTGAPKGRPLWLRYRDFRQPLNTIIRYEAGPEAQVAMYARGAWWLFPGCVTLLDALRFMSGAMTADEQRERFLP